jgi:hypothetical protein
VLLGGSGGLVAAKFVKCQKSYYTEQFEKYGSIRDKYDTTYNTPTPYDPSLKFCGMRCCSWILFYAGMIISSH